LTQLLLEQPNLRSAAEKEAADASARLLAGLLGDSKYAAAAKDLWRVVENFENPLVKADALIALGQTRSTELFPFVLRTLSDLNLRPSTDPEAGEKIAYGAVIAMEKYRMIDGYAPVFFASAGWYSRRVKEQAARTLPFIVDDPSEALSAIIRSGTYDVKLLALEKENASKASADAKAGVAWSGWKRGGRRPRTTSRIGSPFPACGNWPSICSPGADLLHHQRCPSGAFIQGRDRCRGAYRSGERPIRNRSDEAAKALSSF
jgi:hypothetical protein